MAFNMPRFFIIEQIISVNNKLKRITYYARKHTRSEQTDVAE